MKIHVSSFLLGYGAGLGSVFLSKRLRPFLLEVATAGYRVADAMVARVVRAREDLEDLMAEARAHARHVVGEAPASALH